MGFPFSWPPTSSPVRSVFGRIGEIVATLGDYTSSLIANASSVSGATVTDALNTLTGVVVALTSNAISNASGVAGATVTAALNALLAAIATANATIAALTSTSIANASGVAGATVTAALDTLAATGGAVASVFARTGAVVATAGDYTSTLVTNASSVTGATVTAAQNYLLASCGTLALLPRSSPNAYDDEFMSGSADLAARGWTCTNAFTNATMTRVGGIDAATNPSTLGSTQYRSDITPAGLLIQCSGTMYVSKAMPSGSGQFVAVAYVHRQQTQLPDTSIYIAPIQIADSVLINNAAKRFFCDAFDAAFKLSFMNTPQAYTLLSTAYSALTQPGISALTDLHCLYCSIAAGVITYDYAVGNMPFGRQSFLAQSTHGPSGGFTPTVAGFLVQTNVAEKEAYCVMRYIRYYSGVRYVALGVTP